MAAQSPPRPRLRVKFYGNVIRIETLPIQNDNRCQWMVAHQFVQNFKARFFEMCGNIHRTSPENYDFRADPRIGIERTRTAQALKTALAAAGGTAIMGVSPAPT